MEASFSWSQVRPEYWVGLVVPVAVVAGLVWLGRRARTPWSTVARGAALFLAVRIVLLGNPACWHAYERTLDAYEVGWRQRDVIERERERFLRAPERSRYLAVGSSQTGAIYAGYAADHPEVSTFVVAAMSPLDLYLYREYIAARRPERILLYLSDFDVAARPSPGAIVTAPRQGAAFPRLWAGMRAAPAGREYDRALIELLVGDVFPEFKYRFVFQALADSAMQRVSRLAPRQPAPRAARASLEERIAALRDSMDERYTALHLRFLGEFLGHAGARGIEVILVEGQYNPVVSTAETRRVAGLVRHELERMARESPPARFVPRGTPFEFGAEDWVDLSHVRPEAAYEFARQLLNSLE